MLRTAGKISIIFITLILLEFLLQSIGDIFTIYQRNENKKRLSVSKKTDIKIICSGDSSTFGSESSYGNSYPEQLERLLNKEIKKYKFIVYNLGIIGSNSFQLRENLEKNILAYNPDYIIFLTGVNNRWNLSGRNYKISDDLRIEPMSRLLSIVDDLRLVKLVRLITVNIRYKLFLNSIFSVKKSVKKVDAAHFSNKNKGVLLNKSLQEGIHKIEQDISKNNIPQAFIRAKEVLEEYADNAHIHALLGRIHYLQYNYEKSIKEYKKALALEADNISFMQGMALTYRESGEMEKALELYGVIGKLRPQDKMLKMDLRHTFLNFKHKWALSAKEQEIMDYWLKQDLSEIVSISLRYNKKPVLLTYPTQDWQDKIRKNVSQKFSVPLIDIYSRFKSLKNISEYLGETGGHPNDKGYYIMAQEIFDFVKKDLE